jgi:hypothetical protein
MNDSCLTHYLKELVHFHLYCKGYPVYLSCIYVKSPIFGFFLTCKLNSGEARGLVSDNVLCVSHTEFEQLVNT